MANYTDKPLDFNQQVALLKSNGLAFADEQKALHTLQQVSYFRLKSYLMPLMDDKVSHAFKTGTSFEQAFELCLIFRYAFLAFQTTTTRFGKA
jgi:abortive infection bacteriophage resistance protein